MNQTEAQNKRLSIRNEFLEKRCKELWDENESLKFQLFLKSDLCKNGLK